MPKTLTVATYNTPVRLEPHGPAFQRLADDGADLICAQENGDSSPRRNKPKGWKYHRPKRARSTVVYWNPKTVTVTKRGAKRMSRPGFRSLRYAVWVDALTDVGRVRVASVHLPAFYSASEKNRAEYDHQADKLARWFRRRPDLVVGGDYNGSVGGKRMAPIVAAGHPSDPVKTGPDGQTIDYVIVSRAGRLRPRRTRLGPRGRSDHAAVLVDIA